MLSRYADVAPRDWPFRIDEHGRPELAARPAGTPDLRFNVSHTNGLVACAVTVGREVGVDVEHTGRRLVHDVAERFFSPREVADLRACPAADQPVVFFDYWTLKESYIKARGLGLALPLRQFSFLLRRVQSRASRSRPSCTTTRRRGSSRSSGRPTTIAWRSRFAAPATICRSRSKRSCPRRRREPVGDQRSARRLRRQSGRASRRSNRCRTTG